VEAAVAGNEPVSLSIARLRQGVPTSHDPRLPGDHLRFPEYRGTGCAVPIAGGPKAGAVQGPIPASADAGTEVQLALRLTSTDGEVVEVNTSWTQDWLTEAGAPETLVALDDFLPDFLYEAAQSPSCKPCSPPCDRRGGEGSSGTRRRSSDPRLPASWLSVNSRMPRPRRPTLIPPTRHALAGWTVGRCAAG